jgi:hypothetical protein
MWRVPSANRRGNRSRIPDALRGQPGIFHAPLQWKDFAAIEWSALLYPLRRGWLPFV